MSKTYNNTPSGYRGPGSRIPDGNPRGPDNPRINERDANRLNPIDGSRIVIPENNLRILPENGMRIGGEGNSLRMPGEGNPLRMPGEGNPLRMPGEGNPLRMPGEGNSLRMGDNGRIAGEGNPLRMGGEPLRMVGDSSSLRMGAESVSLRMGGEASSLRIGDPGSLRIGGDPGSLRIGGDPSSLRIGGDNGMRMESRIGETSGRIGDATGSGPGARITDILDTLRIECEGLTRELSLVIIQRDELHRKFQQQFQESQSIQTQLFELEKNHQKIVQKYEEEILHLRRQLGQVAPQTPEHIPRVPGEKRPLSSIEVGAAQNLESLAKRHRELLSPNPGTPVPGIPPGLNTPLPGNTFAPNLSISQIAKQAGAPKRTQSSIPTIESPKQPPPSPHPAVLPPSPHLHPLPAHPHPPIIQHSSPPPTQPLPQTQGSPNSTPQNQNPQILLPERTPSSIHPNANLLSGDRFVGKKKKNSENEIENEGSDWVVGYNPNVPRRLDVKLDHDMEHDSVVCCVTFSVDGKYLATGCNHSAQIFDVKTGSKVHVLRDKPDYENDLYIRSVCFAPDGKFLATGAEDKTVKLWDIEKEQIWHNFTGHELDIYSLDFSPNGQFVISGSGDKKVKVWRLDDGKCVHTLGDETVGPRDGVTSVAISPDGRQIAAGSLDRIVRVWDAETGNIIVQLEGHSDSVYSVAFSPDGKTFTSGSLDKTLKLWDLGRQNRQRCRTTLTGHRDFVLSVAFSPDGNWLVSGSKDRSVQFWDSRSSITHMILQGHRNSVINVALTGEKDGSVGKFATGSGDWRARIWHFKTGTFT